MYVIGIHDGHNASVALFKDKQLIFALQEERLTKQKNAIGFPQLALTYLLNYHNLQVKDIDWFMLASNQMGVNNGMKARDWVRESWEAGSLPYRPLIDIVRQTPVYRWWTHRLHKKKIDRLKAYPIPKEKIRVVEHHTTHALTAYFCSHFNNDDKVLIVTSDGGGNKISTTISIGYRGKVERMHTIPDSDSLGHLYSAVTWHLGMLPNEHEYKVMGLAPYAKREEFLPLVTELKKLLFFEDEHSLIWKRGIRAPLFGATPYLEKLFARKRFDIVAGAIQNFCEEMLVELIQRNMKKYNVNKVALSGGVFMNVKANQKVSDIPELTDLFVMPSCGDETNSIGAALFNISSRIIKKDIPPLADNFCIGPAIKQATLFESLQRYADQYHVTAIPDIEKKIAELLAQNKIVARVKGKMEFGARALGHRSILANPSYYENVVVINELIKKRDFWMPFACSILDECVPKYLVNPKKIRSPYMILTFRTQAPFNSAMRAVTHIYDKSTRPQVVTQHADPDFWRLLQYFKQLTGIGCVLNTSFNLHGLPLVSDLQDAMHVLQHSDLTYLAIENYLVVKK